MAWLCQNGSSSGVDPTIGVNSESWSSAESAVRSIRKVACDSALGEAWTAQSGAAVDDMSSAGVRARKGYDGANAARRRRQQQMLSVAALDGHDGDDKEALPVLFGSRRGVAVRGSRLLACLALALSKTMRV